MHHYHNFPSRASEWATSIIMLNWSIVLYMTNGAALHTIFDRLTLLAFNVNVWIFILFSVSATRIVVLIINGRLRRSPHLRSGLSFLSCFLWFQLVLSYATADTITTAIAVYPVILALDFYNAYRVAVEARIKDEGYKNDGPNNPPV